MRKTVVAGLLALGLFGLSVSEASAWACYARSAHGWGVGYGPSLRYAKARALAECAVRTGHWRTCYIRRCR